MTDDKQPPGGITISDTLVDGAGGHGVCIGNNYSGPHVHVSRTEILNPRLNGIQVGDDQQNPLSKFGLENVNPGILAELLAAVASQKTPEEKASLLNEKGILMKSLAAGNNIVELANKVTALCNSGALSIAIAFLQSHIGK